MRTLDNKNSSIYRKTWIQEFQSSNMEFICLFERKSIVMVHGLADESINVPIHKRSIIKPILFHNILKKILEPTCSAAINSLHHSWYLMSHV